MKVIVAGGRNVPEILGETGARKKVYASIKSFLTIYSIDEIVSGTARGVDRLGEKWAKDNGVKLTRMPADWDEYGKRAGYLRNEEMAEYADAVILVWDGKSKGTGHMLALAKEHSLEIWDCRI